MPKKQPYQIYYNIGKSNELVGEIKKPTFKSIMQKIREHSGHVNANARNITKFNNHARNDQIIVTLKTSNNNVAFVVSLPESLHDLIK